MMTLSLFVVSTALSFFAAQSSIIGNLLTKWNNSLSATEKDFLKQKRNLIKEQQQYSMIDDFAKYSKIQRKINAIDEKLQESKSTKNSVLSKIIFAYGPQTVCTFLLVLMTVYYRRTPLFHLPDTIDLTPFNYVISYPNEKNYVSFHFWIMSCNIVARLVKF